jgi:DNA-binding transcriptional regulator YhcF (GntR family)
VEFAINENSPVHGYAQLATQLREKIASGEISERLPSLNQLIEFSGLSMSSVQRATGVLKDEGLIYTVKGRGMFVRRDA